MCDFTGQYHVRCEQIIMLFELMGLLRNRPMFFIRTEHPIHPKKMRENTSRSTPQGSYHLMTGYDPDVHRGRE